MPVVSYPRALALHAAEKPDTPALVVGDETLGFRELDLRSTRFAHALRGRGVASGRFVGIALPNGADFVV